MHFKLAILTSLARRPDGRGTLEEIRRDAKALTANEDQWEKQFPPLADIDILESGLVVTEGDELQITEVGRSLLHALGTITETSLVVAEDRLDLASRPQNSRPIAIDPAERSSPQAPTFPRQSSNYKLQTNTPKVSRREDLFKALAASLERARSFWRRHWKHTTAARRSTGISGLAFALLTLLIVTICAGALVALTHIKNLKTEITSLKRELLPLRERLTKYDQAEKAKKIEITAAAEKSKALTHSRVEQAPLTFSSEEVQLIKEYIKPAPFAGPAAPTLSVGDPVTSGTIPFPSPLTDKVPKLLGARFAIRNGAIIIVRKDSRQADAVLPAY